MITIYKLNSYKCQKNSTLAPKEYPPTQSFLEFAKGKRKAMFSLITVNRLYMFVKLAFDVRQSRQFFGTRCALSPLVDLMREQVKSLSSICISVANLNDLKKGEAEKVLGEAPHSVVFGKRKPEIRLCSQAIVNSETETFFLFVKNSVSLFVRINNRFQRLHNPSTFANANAKYNPPPV